MQIQEKAGWAATFGQAHPHYGQSTYEGYGYDYGYGSGGGGGYYYDDYAPGKEHHYY